MPKFRYFQQRDGFWRLEQKGFFFWKSICYNYISMGEFDIRDYDFPTEYSVLELIKRINTEDERKRREKEEAKAFKIKYVYVNDSDD